MAYIGVRDWRTCLDGQIYLHGQASLTKRSVVANLEDGRTLRAERSKRDYQGALAPRPDGHSLWALISSTLLPASCGQFFSKNEL